MRLLPSTAEPGRPIKVTLRVFHGCGDLPTKKLTVDIPESFILPAPQVTPGWELTTESRPYPNAFQIGDRLVSEGFSRLTWSGHLPTDYVQEFHIAGMTPNAPGEQLIFPIVQECSDGTTEDRREAPLGLRLEATDEAVPGTAEATNDTEVQGGGSESPPFTLILSGLALLFSIIALVRTLGRL